LYTVYNFSRQAEIQFYFKPLLPNDASLKWRPRFFILRKAAIFPMLSRTQRPRAICFFVNAIFWDHPPATPQYPFSNQFVIFYFSWKKGIAAEISFSSEKIIAQSLL